MPNYTDTIVKIFIPNFYTSDQIEVLKQGLANNNDETYLDFESLVPKPEEFTNQLYYDAVSILSVNKWPYPEDEYPEINEEEDLEKAFSSISENHASMLVRAKAIYDKNRDYTEYGWCMKNWGTKWNSSSKEPELHEANDADHYEYDYKDCLYLKYFITTAWTSPVAFLENLAIFCEKYNLGLLAWANYEDGGRRWNPTKNEYDNVWDEIDEVRVEIPEISDTEKKILSEQGFVFERNPFSNK
jgi:hypothetical protein